MIIEFLKIQFRQRIFLIVSIIIPIVFLDLNYFITFLFLQKIFLNTFRNTDFQFTLLNITGAELKEPLKFYNLSWTIWFNLWFIITKIVESFLLDSAIQSICIELLDFNIHLFISFIIGNIISDSDMITVKNSILRFLGMSFIFGVSLSMSYILLRGISILDITPLVNITILLGVISIWHYHVKRQYRIKFIQFYL